MILGVLPEEVILKNNKKKKVDLVGLLISDYSM